MSFLAPFFTALASVVLFVAFRGAWLDLDRSSADLYQRLRFEDYTLTLAWSRGAEAAIRRIPSARLRLSARGDVSWPGGRLPGLVLGAPARHRPAVNDVDVVAGHYLESPGECLVEARFARRHGLAVGTVLQVGARPLRVVGWARSPEFLYYTDERRHPLSRLDALAVLWASDADVEGSGLPTQAGVHGLGAPPELAAWEPHLTPRERHPSHSLLARDRRAFATVALLFPLVLLVLGGGLLVVSTWHLLEGSREELLVLRALGFPARVGVAPYSRLGTLLGAGAALGGWVLGSLLSRVVSVFYAEALGVDFRASWHPELLAAALALTVPVTWGAAVVACRLVVRPTPWLVPLAFPQIRGLRWRLAARNLARTPVRSLLAVLGVGSGVAAMVMVLAFFSSQRQAVELFFGTQRAYDLEVHLRHTLPAVAVPRVADWPGVAQVTGVLSRTVSVDGGEEAMVWGIPAGGLLTLLSPSLEPVQPGSGEWLPGSLHPRSGQAELRYAGGGRGRVRLGSPVLEILTGPYWAALPDLQREAVRHGLPSEAVDCLLVRLDPSGGGVASRLRREPWVETVLDMNQIRAALADVLRMLDAYKAAMLALAVLVAGAVQAGALSLTLSERWPEVRLLRIQGLPFARVLRAEMALVWLLGLALGLPLGMALGTALVEAYRNDVVSLRLTFEPLTLAGAALLAGFQVAAVTRLGERYLGRLPLGER